MRTNPQTITQSSNFTSSSPGSCLKISLLQLIFIESRRADERLLVVQCSSLERHESERKINHVRSNVPVPKLFYCHNFSIIIADK